TRRKSVRAASRSAPLRSAGSRPLGFVISPMRLPMTAAGGWRRKTSSPLLTAPPSVGSLDRIGGLCGNAEVAAKKASASDATMIRDSRFIPRPRATVVMLLRVLFDGTGAMPLGRPCRAVDVDRHGTVESRCGETGRVAQGSERFLDTEEVRGSSPRAPTMN